MATYPPTAVLNASSSGNIISSKTCEIAQTIYRYLAQNLPKNFPESLTNHILNNFDQYINSTNYKTTTLFRIFQHVKLLILSTRVLKKNILQNAFTYLLDYFPYYLFQRFSLFPVFQQVIENSYFDVEINDVILETPEYFLYDDFVDDFYKIDGLNTSSTFTQLTVSFD